MVKAEIYGTDIESGNHRSVIAEAALCSEHLAKNKEIHF